MREKEAAPLSWQGAANPGNHPCCRLKRLEVPTAAHSSGTSRVLGSLPSVQGIVQGAPGGQTRGLAQNVVAKEAGDAVSA